jgi:adenosylcobinamide-phosphate synthase
MSFLSLLLALLIEQARPLVRGNWVHGTVRTWVNWISQTLDAGHPRLAWTTWSLAVGLPAVLATVVHWFLIGVFGWPVAMIWSVAVLYVTLGFRQFSHHFTDIRDALDVGDERLARELLAEWQHVEVDNLPRSELLRHVIEHSVLSAHHHVFGVLTWFSVLAALGFGPAGAVIYRMSDMVSHAWQAQPKATKGWVSDTLQNAAREAWRRVDWLPSRLTAVAFAVVGNFEEAIDCWRNHATAGALTVRLGGEALRANDNDDTQDSESTPGRTPEMVHLSSVVGLVWRSVVLWMVLLALLTLARLLG